MYLVLTSEAYMLACVISNNSPDMRNIILASLNSINTDMMLLSISRSRVT